MITKPIPTACEIFTNSRRSAVEFPHISVSRKQSRSPVANQQSIYIRLVHLFRNCVPSRKKSLGISAISLKFSDMVEGVETVERRDKVLDPKAVCVKTIKSLVRGSETVKQRLEDSNLSTSGCAFRMTTTLPLRI